MNEEEGKDLGSKAGDPVVVLQLYHGGPLLLILHQALQQPQCPVSRRQHSSVPKGRQKADRGQSEGSRRAVRGQTEGRQRADRGQSEGSQRADRQRADRGQSEDKQLTVPKSRHREVQRAVTGYKVEGIRHKARGRTSCKAGHLSHEVLAIFRQVARVEGLPSLNQLESALPASFVDEQCTAMLL